jgi:hypothetical protein
VLEVVEVLPLITQIPLEQVALVVVEMVPNLAAVDRLVWLGVLARSTPEVVAVVVCMLVGLE